VYNTIKIIKLLIKGNNMKEEFRTSDFYVAVFCKTKGMKLTGMDKSNPRSVFIFEDQDDREEMIRNYWDACAIVEPKAFVENIRSLRQMLFSDSFGENN